MATKIRLMRLGKIRAPYYRIVVADSRTKREGRVIETIGKYHPKEEPSLIQIDGERAAYWLSVGAQPTEPVAALLRKTGDWQKFKGEPAPPPLLVAAPKEDRKMIFEAAAKQSIADQEAEAKPKKAAAPAKPKKVAETPAAEAVVETAAAEAPATEAVATETPATETPATETPVADAPEAAVTEAAVTEPAASEPVADAEKAATTETPAE